MRIGIDARELTGQRTGVGRYLHEVLRAWSASPRSRAHHFVLFSSDAVDTAPYAGLPLTAVVAPGHGLAWEQLRLPRLLAGHGIDVLLAPAYTAPLATSVPVVLVVHDVSFVSHPEWFSWREGARRRTVTRLAARRARRVVTVSHFSKAEIESHLGVPGRDIVAIPNGTTRILVPSDVRRESGTILYVGSIFNRRHVPALIEAVGLLTQHGADVRLEIVGDNRTMPRVDLGAHARAAGVANRVRIRAYVDDEELAASYGRAAAFAFLSDYEGFGLTPLEALSAGVPVVVLDRPTTREVLGDCATYVAEPTAPGIARGLTAALFDDRERQRVLAGAARVLARHSWIETASGLFDVLTAVARPAVAARA